MNVKITTEYITLGNFLKFENIVSSGGEAKLFLSEVEILVDNEKENRRGRKLYPGTTILVLGKTYLITRA